MNRISRDHSRVDRGVSRPREQSLVASASVQQSDFAPAVQQGAYCHEQRLVIFLWRDPDRKESD
jgi:leucyl aminopeptidase (aminopeptidase T)